MIDLRGDLITFELANNHHGNMSHARALIRELSQIRREYGLRAALKVQLRHLQTLIHPAARVHPTAKHVRRFLDTQLSDAQFQQIVSWAREGELIPMATVFDEDSISTFEELGFEILKVASASATDYPLLRRLAVLPHPTILSTAGLSFEQVEMAARVLRLNQKPAALMHCVALYPTPERDLGLGRIRELQKRFPQFAIGYSTHETPQSVLPGQLATAMGVRLFEKHVDLPSNDFQMNSYSASPADVRRWIEGLLEARVMCQESLSQESAQREAQSLRELKRGAFAKESLETGAALTGRGIQFQMPAEPGQLLAEDFPDVNEVRLLKTPVSAQQAIPRASVAFGDESGWSRLREEYVRRALEIVHQAGIRLPENYSLELSHHYGTESFLRFGAVLITVLNRTYCKKLIVMFSGQSHPAHFHNDREESLSLVSGRVEAVINKELRTMIPGEYVHLERGTHHEFIARADSVIEELSTWVDAGVSQYLDEQINRTPKDVRKTYFESKLGGLSFIESPQPPRDQARDLE